jgi:DNA-binding MarR family transcriptional regulator
MRPRCPGVLALLEAGPRRPHDVARALDGDYPAACMALRRLEDARLVRRRTLAGRAEYLLTTRGRRELRLHRLLWGRVALYHLADRG